MAVWLIAGMGGFEPVAKPIFGGHNGVPKDFSFALLPDDWEHFEQLYLGAVERVPSMGEARATITQQPLDTCRIRARVDSACRLGFGR